jgi:hypothetical protein
MDGRAIRLTQLTQEMKKFCIDCKHASLELPGCVKCVHPIIPGKAGTFRERTAAHMRDEFRQPNGLELRESWIAHNSQIFGGNPFPCGKSAALFEPKDESN